MNITEFMTSKPVQAKLKKEGYLQEELSKGISVEQILEIPPILMQKLHKAACHLFETHKYAAATDGFLFLIALNAYQHEYWIGLGMATQMCGEFESAVDAYEMAAIYNPENPVPYFYLAKCLFAMHERQSALLALDMAINYAQEVPKYQELKHQALEAQAQLKKHIQ